VSRPVIPIKRSALYDLNPPNDDMEVDEEETESSRRVMERWRFDMDDVPSIGPQGVDEQDRILVDDYDPK